MNTSYNFVLPTAANADDMISYITAAETEYGNSKTTAMKSAANAYLVWHHGESDYAELEMRNWIDEEIKKRNEEIMAFNSDIDDQKRRAKEFSEGKINEELTEDEKINLGQLNLRTVSEWARAKKMKIEGREGGSRFTRILKFVFRFDKPTDASLVSRYARVLEFIEQNKSDLKGELNVDAIVELLNETGGFEAALDKMRNPEAANEDKVRVATLNKIKAAVDRSNGGEEISLRAKYEQNGYVFLVGRASANGIKVCGELAVNDNEATSLLLKVDQSVIGSAEPTVEFAARVASLGELVRDGRDSTISKDGTQAGAKHKVTRTYSITNFGGEQRMVVSARYADASAVVHACPKSEIQLGNLQPDQAVLLDGESSSQFSKLFSSAARRLLMTINATGGDASVPINWSVTTDLGTETSESAFEWASMYTEEHCPVDMRYFDPKCTMSISMGTLREVYDGYLNDWGKNKTDDQKVNKPLTISINGIVLTVGHEVYGTKTFDIGQKQGSPASLEMRPRDLVDLFKKLIELNVEHCAMHIDMDGLLAMSWEDEVGSYVVYLPSVEKRGTLNRNCLSYMKPKQ